MMRHLLLFRRGRLRAEHGKFAIQLKCVGADDFAFVFARQSERDFRFSDRGGAGEENTSAENFRRDHRTKRKRPLPANGKRTL